MELDKLGARAVVARRLRVFRSPVPHKPALYARAAVRPRFLRGRAHEPAVAGLHERRRGNGVSRRRGSDGMAHVGVIGLGAMGAPMARNLLKRGHTVTVFARRAEAMAPLTRAGARGAASPAEVASQSDVTITMVLDSQAVEHVTIGPGGIIESAKPGSVVVDHSTIDPETARRVAKTLATRSIEMIDAPVSGGAAVADAGTLSVMAGGDQTVLERVRPILECYATTIAHIGPSGAGQVAKACNQICTIVNTLGAAEAMVMAEGRLEA